MEIDAQQTDRNDLEFKSQRRAIMGDKSPKNKEKKKKKQVDKREKKKKQVLIPSTIEKN